MKCSDGLYPRLWTRVFVLRKGIQLVSPILFLLQVNILQTNVLKRLKIDSIKISINKIVSFLLYLIWFYFSTSLISFTLHITLIEKLFKIFHRKKIFQIIILKNLWKISFKILLFTGSISQIIPICGLSKNKLIQPSITNFTHRK